MTDEVCAAACSGDPAALRAVYDELSPAVCGYLRAKGFPLPADSK